jgi:Flp pilus assembly protein TadD
LLPAVHIGASIIALAAAASAQSSDYEQGVALFKRGQAAAAVPPLTRAAEAHPLQAQMWKALGVAYAAQGLYHEAEPPLRRACELDPKLPDACYFQGRALYALDRYEASLQVLERATNREPQSWKPRLGMAQSLEALGKTEEAGKQFRQSLALCRNSDPQPGIAFARFLLRQGRAEEAVAPLEEVLRRFPASGDAHLHLGRALLEKGDIAAAIAHLERAVSLEPASAQAHLLLAKAYVRAGRAAEAEPHFEAAVRYQQTPRN